MSRQASERKSSMNAVAKSPVNLAASIERLGNDQELMDDLIVVFFEDAPEQLARARAAVDRGDLHAAHAAAHILKSLCANFDASDAVTVIQDFERAALRGDSPAAREGLENLDREMERVTFALRDWLNRCDLRPSRANA